MQPELNGANHPQRCLSSSWSRDWDGGIHTKMESSEVLIPRTHPSNAGFFMWLRHPQRGLPYLICSILVILIFLPFIIHYYLSNFGMDDPPPTLPGGRMKLDRGDGKFGPTKVSDIKFQIDELRAIKASVNNELLELEKKRQSLQTEVANYNAAIDSLKQNYQATNQELERLKVTFKNLQVEQREMAKSNTPNIEAPRRILPTMIDDDSTSFESSSKCRLHSCFDYSRCSITSQFPVYIYHPDEHRFSTGVESFVKYSVMRAFDSSPHITYDPFIACLFVVLIGELDDSTTTNVSHLEEHLQRLPYWRQNGTNHLLLNIARRPTNIVLFDGVDTGRALIAQSTFTATNFRRGFDIVLPPALGLSHGDIWDQLPLLIPARRKYLLSFVGEYSQHFNQNETMHLGNFDANFKNTNSIKKVTKVNDLQRTTKNDLEMLIYYDNLIVETLKSMQTQFASDGFYLQFICDGSRRVGNVGGEWNICGSDSDRHDLYLQSTFSLIIAPTDYHLVSTTVLQTRLYEALKCGAIPVILGDHIVLPFNDFADWSVAVVPLPKSRMTELHFILRSFTDADILEMRRQGRLIFETYFGTTKSIVNTILASVRTRLRIPAFPIREEPSPSVFNQTFLPVTETVVDALMEAEEMLGPVEPALNSPRYLRNFTTFGGAFTLPGDPFHIYPYTPFEPVMPADAKFIGSAYGFRPIGLGVGGTGKEFGEALGGNVQREQFTVVILTYEREAVLINAIARLKGLPHLNKVVVVWNNQRPPAEDLRWPDIGVEVHVIRTARNSLNNRFLPYDAIQTEAILSVDDDAHLRHDEIMFGFRIWREARDRIVGFPGRYNAWDLNHHGWLYNSNYSCELSMVLTGAAFFHKYYAYLYSYVMPQAIRDKVDEYLNCEDLAMNFLVAHITRKPPIKVTSRWTFRCPGCPKALSVEDSHFHERHKCINFFVQVYGYMPLLNTQFRADSVLFKTRIPHDKQKCFKFI